MLLILTNIVSSQQFYDIYYKKYAYNGILPPVAALQLQSFVPYERACHNKGT